MTLHGHLGGPGPCDVVRRCWPMHRRRPGLGLGCWGLVGVVGDAAGDVGVFVEVVAGAHAVVAIGDLQGDSVGVVAPDEQDW